MFFSIWTFLTGSITLITGFLWLHEKYKYVSLRPRLLRFKKRNIGKDLKILAKKLGQFEEWLSSLDSNIITDELMYDMWRIGSKVKLEGLSYVALHSSNIEEVKMALRNLSQVQGKESVKRAIKVIEGVKNYPLYTSSKGLIDLVNDVLKELRELLQLEEGDFENKTLRSEES